MSRTEVTKRNEIIGLDVGTSRIVTARQINNEINMTVYDALATRAGGEIITGNDY